MEKSKVEKDCKLWASEIANEYIPDLIIFVAKSGYLFAKPMVEIFNCPMVDICAIRPHNSVKDKGSNLIELIPQKIILTILSSPLMYKYNEIKKRRDIIITKKFLVESSKKYERLLIVDDSIDTGWTMSNVKREIRKYFQNAEIRIASYSFIEYGKKRVGVDYYRHLNKLILTATSRKSEEYAAFIDEFERWSKKNEEAAEKVIESSMGSERRKAR